MILAHLTLPTARVAETADFLARTLGYPRLPLPANSPVEAVWFDLGGGQEMHVLFVEGYEVSPFEGEFGRHVALLHPLPDFAALRRRLLAAGADLLEEIRPAPFERFFFREPVNGYVFEIVDSERRPQRS
jgi:hypothetical protein